MLKTTWAVSQQERMSNLTTLEEKQRAALDIPGSRLSNTLGDFPVLALKILNQLPSEVRGSTGKSTLQFFNSRLVGAA